MGHSKPLKLAATMIVSCYCLSGCIEGKGSSSSPNTSTASSVVTTPSEPSTNFSNTNSLSFADPALEACVLATKQEFIENISNLVCNNKGVVSLEGIEQLSELKTLFLSFNQIQNIDPLASLYKLKTLYINGNQISDISALSGLSNLTSLSMQKNDIYDISALNQIDTLKNLNVRKNLIQDFSALDDLDLEKFSGKEKQKS